MPRTAKAILEDADCTEDGESRNVRFYASFALNVEVPVNYMTTMSANITSYNASHMYRLSYKLFPHEVPTVIDVAFFGHVVKLYCADQTICLKVHEETCGIWIAWSKLHVITITDKSLLNLFDYVCNVTVSEAGERVLLDRPKGFRVPDAFYESMQFLKMYSEWLDTPTESGVDTPVNLLHNPDLLGIGIENLSNLSVKSIDIENAPPWQEIDEIFLSSRNTGSNETSISESDQSSASTSIEKIIMHTSCGLQPPANFNYKLLWGWIIAKTSCLEDSEYFQVMDDIPKRQIAEDWVEDAVNVKLKRVTKATNEPKLKRAPAPTILPILQIKMQAFFTGILAQVCQMDPRQNPSTLKNALFLVSVEDDLMSFQQKTVYNPLSVQLRQVEDLPQLDPSITDEDEFAYKPAFLKYRLLNHKIRRSKPMQHDMQKIVFKDSHVYLLGTMSPEKIRELFSGPPLIIEVHDRDSTDSLKNMLSPNPAIFGTEKTDRCLGSNITAERKLMNINPFYLDHPYSMYGVAQLNMSEFLYGSTKLEFCESVMSSQIQKRRQIVMQKFMKEPFNPDDIYLNAGTALEATLILSVPLFNPTLATTEECLLLPHPYFSRVIVKFSSSEREFLGKLMKTVVGMNTTQLKNSGYPSVYCLGLTMPLLPIIEKVRQSLDIITGVHIYDTNFHVFYLEGQAMGCMRSLWKRLLSITDFHKIKVLYNSAMIFGERLYLFLPPFLCHLRLRLSLIKLLNSIDCKPDTSGLPDQCQECLRNIHQLKYCETLEEVTRNNLFPTKSMILAMSQKVGRMVNVIDITKLMASTEDKCHYYLRQPIIKSPKKMKTSRVRFKPSWKANG